jgi:hypothetical protein
MAGKQFILLDRGGQAVYVDTHAGLKQFARLSGKFLTSFVQQH